MHLPNAEHCNAVTKIVVASRTNVRFRKNAKAEFATILPAVTHRFHAGGMVRDRHGLAVLVQCLVDELVFHQA